MKLTRSSGLLMHITSLPGKYGIGTMGKEAYEFIDNLKSAGQSFWQILPIGPVSSIFGFSPYSSLSSFAGNYLFIDLESLQDEPWLSFNILSSIPEETENDFVDFNFVAPLKLSILKKASVDFFMNADTEYINDFHEFIDQQKYWIVDYALFMALSDYFKTFSWPEWDSEIRYRNPEAIKKYTELLRKEIHFHKFLQYVFFRQYGALKSYAKKQGIKIIGDIPIYITYDSADAWANPAIFQVDPETSLPSHIAGVPPDYFSPTGQRWGNPLYKWKENNALFPDTFEWWKKRFKYMFKLFDLTRVDHFRGFESYWSIPVTEETAINGKWERGPGLEFFTRMKLELGNLPIIAEDLGIITPEVEQLRDTIGAPGMKILQFAFDFDKNNTYLPHNLPSPNCIIYTGTHDNNTTNGWFYENDIDEPTRNYIADYMNLPHRDSFHWEFIRLALSSIAALSIFPTQDILGYGSPYRMNTPGQAHNNWAWKLTPGRLTNDILQELHHLCKLYNRI